jgi:HEAT repeat protein
MNNRPLALLSLSFGILLAGCVTDNAIEPVESKTETRVQTANKAEYGRTLQLLDRHVAKYAMLKSMGTEDAKRERYVERSTCVSMVRLVEPQLIETAGDPSDLGRQRIAAVSLSFSTDPAAVATLSRILDRRGDTRLMVNATFALSELKSPATPAAPLVDMLSHRDRDVRNNTLLALYRTMDARYATGAETLSPRLKAEALPLLEAALFDPEDPQIRGHAAACLGTIRDTNSVDPLINVLPDPNTFVRMHTAVALANIGDPRAIAPLVAVIDDTPSGPPRSTITTALAVIVERAGRTVPPYLDQSERAWKSYLKERLGPEDFEPSGVDYERR